MSTKSDLFQSTYVLTTNVNRCSYVSQWLCGS